MAKIVFSAVVGDARKKIGGTVFTKSRFGAIVRRKVSPIQPRTNAQRAVRANFTAVSKAWSGVLDDPKRLAWSNLAAANPVKDRFGNSQILTGLQMYERVNRALNTISVARLDIAPLTLTGIDLGGCTLSQAAGPLGALSITVNNAAGELYKYVITASPYKSPGRTFVGKAYRIIEVIVGTTAMPYDFTTALKAKFGDFATGQRLNIGIYVVTIATGAIGKAYTATLISN
jgi:hypothetical protein